MAVLGRETRRGYPGRTVAKEGGGGNAGPCTPRTEGTRAASGASATCPGVREAKGEELREEEGFPVKSGKARSWGRWRHAGEPGLRCVLQRGLSLANPEGYPGGTSGRPRPSLSPVQHGTLLRCPLLVTRECSMPVRATWDGAGPSKTSHTPPLASCDPALPSLEERSAPPRGLADPRWRAAPPRLPSGPPRVCL